MPGTVFITGAGAGIGAATARLLAGDGYTVYAGVHSGAGDLEGAAGVSLVPLDVTDPDSVAKAARHIAAEAPDGLQAIVNNAGIIVQGPLELTRPEDLEREFAVNTLGPAYVTQAFLPLLRAGHGRVVNISAPTGRVAIPFMPALSASKAALFSLSDALRLELAPWGIPVIVVSPGVTDTRIFAKADGRARSGLATFDPDLVALYQGRLLAAARASARQRPAPVEPVARTVAAAVRARSPKRSYTVGRDARLASILALLPAGLRERAVASALGFGKA
jgi:NAD(P)-dependent dehydrogenase (short-subunit alcohol dehydrogenase family)